MLTDVLVAGALLAVLVPLAMRREPDMAMAKCPDCGKSMMKGGKCPGCGYSDKGKGGSKPPAKKGTVPPQFRKKG